MEGVKTKRCDVEQESQAVAVEAIANKIIDFVPSFKRTLYMSLFARAEGVRLPKAIAEEFTPSTVWALEDTEKMFDEIVGEMPKSGQEIILAKLLKALEPEEAEYELEMARDKARDELLDAVNKLPIPSQTTAYESLKIFFESCGTLAAAS